MASFVSDLRYAVRQAVQHPGFLAMAVVSLALGIGATTAVFSVVYAALFNPFPYRDVDRIVRMTIESPGAPGRIVALNAAQLRQVVQSPVVESALVMDYRSLTLTGHDLPAPAVVVDIVASGFDDLGMRMSLGRGIKPPDAPQNRDPRPVVALSYKYWRREFQSDPNIAGKSLQLDHKTYAIVGVVAPRYTWYSADVYRPLDLTASPERTFIVDLRLRSGVSRTHADAAIEPLVRQFAHDYPKRFPERFHVKLEGLNEWVLRTMSGTLYLLLGSVGLLLLIGCANVSILLLARGAVRHPELALRVALGANRGRLIRQLLTESMLLAGMGVALGVAMSYGILAGIRALLPRYAFAPEVEITINLPVLIFSAAIAAATGILFGWWPALRLSRADVGSVMQSGARRVAGSASGRRTHHLLIAGQVAFTLLLLAAAGSAGEGFARLMRTPLGYDPHNVLSLTIPLHENSYPTWATRAAYFDQLRAKVAEAPGVLETAISSNATPPMNGWTTRLDLSGVSSRETPTGVVNMIGSRYFSALKIPLVEGRLLSEFDTRRGALVAVINHAFASRYFPNGGAIGHTVRLTHYEEGVAAFVHVPRLSESPLEIIGVVGDAVNDGIVNPVKPSVYVPYTLSMGTFTQILVRTAPPPLTLLRTMRGKLAAVNPEQQTLADIEDLETWVRDEPEWQQQRLVAWIFGVFAALALALAVVGLYSVVSYTAARRTAEFGIRMALGAQRGHVMWVVFQSTLTTVAAGIVAGVALTLLLNSLVGHWVRGAKPDAMVLLTGTILMIAAAALACAIPALRAACTDPMQALRCE